MTSLTWFKFSPSKWSLGKTKKLSPEQAADYLDLCCSYWVNDCKMQIEEMREHSDYVDLFMQRGLICEEGIFWLNEQFDEAKKKSETARDNVKKRWSKKDTPVIQPYNGSNTPVIQRERKIERKKERQIEKEIVDS